MTTLTLSIEGMTCDDCVPALRSALDGVPDVRVDLVTLGAATIRIGDRGTGPLAVVEDALDAVADAGFLAELATADDITALFDHGLALATC